MIETIKNKVFGSNVGSVIHSWYLSQTSRDQLVIQAVTFIVLASITWLIVIQPSINWHNQQKTNERLTYALLSTIKNNANELVATKSNPYDQSTKNSAIIPIITKTANLNKIQLSRLQPVSDSAVVVYLEEEEFNSALKWVVQLRENNKIRVDSVTIESEETNGLISAQISFIR